MEKAVFITVHIMWSSYKPVYVRETPYIAILTAEEVLWSTCRPVYEPVKTENAIFTTAEVLWNSWKPVYMRETPYKAIFTFTAEEVLSRAPNKKIECAPISNLRYIKTGLQKLVLQSYLSQFVLDLKGLSAKNWAQFGSSDFWSFAMKLVVLMDFTWCILCKNAWTNSYQETILAVIYVAIYISPIEE